MGVSNRSRQSVYSGDRNKGWNFVRGAFALIALIGISFLFGFFILARLMPDTRATNNGISTTNTSEASPQTNSVAPVTNAPVSPPTEAKPKRDANAAGITLEPEEENTGVQQPATPDTTGSGSTPSNNETQNNASPNGEKPSENSVPPSGSTERKSETTEPVQSPTTPDSERTSRRDRERAPRNTNETTTPSQASPVANSSSLFRVQVGVYSTKEAAEQEAAKVRERGFDATVHATSSGGRTLYHIQNGVYRNRTNAEAMRQRLKDAGIETHIAELSSGTTGKP